MVQYPDSIVVTLSASASQNASGIWTEGASSSFSSLCRVEVNNSGRQIMGVDGTVVDYAFTVYLPPAVTIIPVGSDCELTTLLNGIIRGKIKGVTNGQLNSRIWL